MNTFWETQNEHGHAMCLECVVQRFVTVTLYMYCDHCSLWARTPSPERWLPSSSSARQTYGSKCASARTQRSSSPLFLYVLDGVVSYES